MADEKILVVDDEPGVRATLEAILRDEGYDVDTAASAEDGLERLGGRRFDAVLLDVWLPGMDGLEALVRMRERRVDAEVVMISGHGTIETAVRATKLGAFDFVEKPLSLEKTLLVLRNALKQRRLEERNRRLLEQLARDTEILGASPAAARVRADVDAASSVDAPVLVCGEPGSGRETVARRVHASGRRGQQAIVAVACAALDAEAGARVLLGDGAGGRVRLAARGSLFLEDVDALSLALQARLAAALDPRNPDAPDVRVLASAGPGASGVEPALRRLLDVVRIDVPPLRDRREDVPLLAARFLRDLSREYGKPEPKLSAAALAALVRHDWPGNVRELRNLLERIVVTRTGDEVRVEDLPQPIGKAAASGEDLYREFATLADGIAAFDRYFIRRALHETRGDPAAAASRLGLSLADLEARRRALGFSI